ncbi:peptidase domain-containing ABC transporter [Dyadobacter sp. CY312]|uniref:peptidase domain-containing ABC transporter n=1 Tax=Dyadobacter sp. CY312 TaxID=2907303 RepID=UPI001F1CDE50|nr:ATP-binding cassette domain-containing protein [Dyadobacter sp. CY312]MCE7038847.1 ATP-binding cassette domain-containing protein [Dyadobacter sp. CY312]
MQKVTPLQRLWRLIKLEKPEIVSIYFYAILSGLIQLSVPVGIQAIIGFVLGASMVTSIYVLIFLVVLGVAAVGILQINQMKIIEKIQQKIFTRNAFQFADIIPRFDLLKTDSYYLPEKVNRFFDTLNVQKGLSKLLLDVPIASIQIIFGLLLLGVYHSFFIIFGLVLLLILWLIFYFTGKDGLDSSLEESRYKYRVVEWHTEMARSINPFKASTESHLNLRKTDDYVTGYLNSRTTHFRVLLFQYKTLVSFKVAITLAMLSVGTYLLLSQQLNIGEFIAAEIVILTVINAVEKLIVSLESVYDVVTGLEKIATVTEGLTEGNGDVKFSQTSEGLDIELNELSFSYPAGRKIFENFTLKIPAGSTIAIATGESTGKTSLLKVLAGYYRDLGGSFMVNNIPLTNYDSESLRSNFGVYLNQKEIFGGTVFENITMGKTDITQQQIIDFAKKTGLIKHLKSLPDGLTTVVSPGGKQLQGRTLRSILLLRAFIGEPKVLILEEPWDQMDGETRGNLIAYLRSLPQHVTVVVATNDEEFSAESDYIISLKAGIANITKN